MRHSLFTHVFTFIIGTLTGIAILAFFDAPPDHSSVLQVDNPTVTAAQVAAVEQQLRSKVDSLFLVNHHLQDKVAKTQSSLHQVRQKNRELRYQVQEMILFNDTATDTSSLLNNCDSLAKVADDLLLLNNTKDSLHEAVTTYLQQQLTGKDSTITLQEQQYDTLKVSFDKSLLQQQGLIEASQQFCKKINRQKKGSRLFSAALIFIGGLFTYSTIK